MYANALSNAHQFVYLENQYFWTHAYYTPLGLGVKLDLEASESPDMERNVHELAEALRREATVALVLPMQGWSAYGQKRPKPRQRDASRRSAWQRV